MTNKSQKEFLLDLISQILDGDMKKEYLEKLKNLILEEEDKTPKFTLNASSSSLTNIYKQIPIPNPFQQITTKDLQQEINHLKTEVRYLKTEVLNLKTTDLTIEAKLALLQTQNSKPEIPTSVSVDIFGISDTERSTTQFLRLMLLQINLKKNFC